LISFGANGFREVKDVGIMNNFGQEYEFQVSTMLALYASCCL
jgi:hypothetical protein